MPISGKGADYHVTREGALYAKGLAHRGQYGDGRLTATPGFVATARDVVTVKAHTGHAIHLTQAARCWVPGATSSGRFRRMA